MQWTNTWGDALDTPPTVCRLPRVHPGIVNVHGEPGWRWEEGELGQHVHSSTFHPQSGYNLTLATAPDHSPWLLRVALPILLTC